MWIDEDIFLIDHCHLGRPEIIASYLVRDEVPALVEVGPTRTVERLLRGIEKAGMDPRDLQLLLVTHIHLDHAGASGELVRRFPHLKVYVHAVGAPHLQDPSRLIRSAQKIFGDDLDRLWGEVVPVPPEAIHVVQEGERIRLGRRTLVAVDTPGHAPHHVVYWDEERGDVFTGDIAGVSLPGVHYVRPPTPPPDLDLESWSQSLQRLRLLRPRRLLLTHYGPKGDVMDLLDQLEERLYTTGRLVKEGLEKGIREEEIAEQVKALAAQELRAFGGEDLIERYDIASSYLMNVQGYIRYYAKRSGGGGSPPS
ncbi:MAG: MBL fold metallo-hydrolase [Armatimonadota bacterium]|nr:MBL fold metallo-hydrolase [Armatimonadota bacterium]MDR5702482.1 MBL fold metallo-hydrolase [Armatimonadota bacterium]